MKENVLKLLDFLYKSPTAFHAVANSVAQLETAGFKALCERDEWDIAPGGKYYVVKNSSCFFAFIAGTDAANPAVRAIVAHTDSPSFVIKPNPQMAVNGHLRLNTSPYGGVIMHTWFDRPLALAGRVLLKGENVFAPIEKLINLNKPLVIIPSLAIHLNREVNKGYAINPQADTLPLAGLINDQLEQGDYLLNLLTKELGCEADEILDFDLSLYEYAKGGLVGENEDMISAGRLDDLWMVYAGLQALINATPAAFTQVLYAPDNEEIGSMTAHGAQSRFFGSIVERIVGQEAFSRALANSYIMSADLAHATNPNHPDKDDPTTKTVLGGGAVLKYSANQKYATNGRTAAVFKALCIAADVPCQGYITRSDVVGGGTVGAMMSANLGVDVVDMGMPVVGMHSIRELAATADNEYVLKLFETFYKEI